MGSTPPTLLEQLEASGCKVDIDSYDPEVAKSLPFTPHDATSNQALIGLVVYAPQNRAVVDGVIRSMPGSNPHDILTILVCPSGFTSLIAQHAKFAKVQLANISGRVLAQTTPTYPDVKEKILEHARDYARAFNAEGISNDRFCIKIPTTTAGVQAAVILKQEGIATLGTALFSLPQAIAASQAGMHAISPYFNPCKAHGDPAFWADVEDPLSQHPMSNRMLHIRQTYDRLAKETCKPQPQIKGAGYITGREVMAQRELGCDHVTILPASLHDLLSTSRMPPYQPDEHSKRFFNDPNLVFSDWKTPDLGESTERLAKLASADPYGGKMQADFKMASTDVDYLADGVLDECNRKDEVTRWRLEDAIATFKKAEDELFEWIAEVQGEVSG